jgi:uncharacterized protein (DUF433 family)
LSVAERLALIEEHVGLDYDLFGGRADARLKKSGVSVWAIVTYIRVYHGDLDKVKWHFELSQEELDGALAYDRQNKEYVDARLRVNQA